MVNWKAIANRFLKSIRFHGERWRLFPAHYPQRIVTRRLDRAGVRFEVANITEANRVRYFDGEEDFLSAVLADLRPNDVFFDVGACIGLYTLHASRHCGMVFAFEPDLGFRHHLEANIALNDVQNVTILPFAVSDRSSKMSLYTDGIGGKSPSLNNDGFISSIEVDAKTLDELVFQKGIQHPTVIKMDIEGAEILALKGMKRIFEFCPPRVLFMELHPVALIQFGSSQQEVLDLLARAGYLPRTKVHRDKQVHFVFERR